MLVCVVAVVVGVMAVVVVAVVVVAVVVAVCESSTKLFSQTMYPRHKGCVKKSLDGEIPYGARD